MTDIVEAVLADHRELTRLLEDVAASGDARNRRGLVDQAIAELARHWAAEEQVLYPVVRGELPDRELAAHARGEQVMVRLLRTDAVEPEFEGLVGRLVAEVVAHFGAEERVVLPLLRDGWSAEERAELGRKYELARKVAPTRPHPGAPDTPPGNRLAEPGMALVDRVRDVLSRRHT